MSEGEIAAEVFRRFDRGDTLVQIVRKLKLAASQVRELHTEWSTPLRAARKGSTMSEDHTKPKAVRLGAECETCSHTRYSHRSRVNADDQRYAEEVPDGPCGALGCRCTLFVEKPGRCVVCGLAAAPDRATWTCSDECEERLRRELDAAALAIWMSSS
jgi:predicted nucleic acid-binding Zn ribbon protein